MEALRKAEEAKRRMQEEQAAARDTLGGDPSGGPRSDGGFTLEEREPSVTPEYIRDNFTTPPDTAVEEIPAEPAPQVAADTPAHDASARTLARHQQRNAAASVFAAKQNPSRNRRTLTLLVGLMLLIIPIGGGVLWYLQNMDAASIGINPAIANYDLSSRSLSDVQAATPAPAAAAPVASASETPVAPEPGASTLAAAAEPDESAELEATEEAPAPEPAAPAVAQTTAPPGAVPPAATPVPALTLPVTSPSVLEVSRTRATSQVDPNLSAAYARVQAGDLPQAGQLYRQVLAERPNNRDALLGLALVHMREGQPAMARELYARLLQLNPRDPLAHTGLLQTMQASDPVEHESALKQLLAQYPNVAQLTLALGNHYASQQRWSEAQAAYYNALLTASRATNGPVHPDYAFNLAVSLERLNQPRAALDYYRQAQALAAEVQPGFDLRLLNSRLAYLLEQTQP